MVLDTAGGPTYINFTADAPIVISENRQEFYKQPLYYAMGHFSKYIIPGSKRIKIQESDKEKWNNTIKILAFRRPDDLHAIIIFNK